MRILIGMSLLVLIFFFSACATVPTPVSANIFDGARAFEFLVAQMDLGLRPAGSAANRATGDYILEQLKEYQWKTETQEFVFRGVPVRNIIGKNGEGRGPLILLGAHYDTRIRADQDKFHAEQGVPGANDGASGVAVLLELARTLDVSKLRNEVWLVFFDAEDNGEIDGCLVLQIADPPADPAGLLRGAIPGGSPRGACDHSLWPWSVGATYAAEHLSVKPDAVVVVDMVGDADQDIYYEQNSDKQLQAQLWGIAASLGYSAQFIPQYRWSMEDDHTPFLQRGVRAVDIIDFDYPYWHTTQDTADKVSAASLERVGRVLQVWLEGR